MVLGLRGQTAWSIDKYLAYGIWFATISAGYACSSLSDGFPEPGDHSPPPVAQRPLCIRPSPAGSQHGSAIMHGPMQTHSLVPSGVSPPGARDFSTCLAQEANIAEYYTQRGSDWTRWRGGISFDPVLYRTTRGIPITPRTAQQEYGVIALFYSTTFSSVRIPGDILAVPKARSTPIDELLGLVGNNSGEPGLPALTLALENDHDYRMAAVGHYNTSNISGTHAYGVYAIWQKKGA